MFCFSFVNRVLKVLLVLNLLPWFFLSYISEAIPTYVFHICPNTSTYSPQSTYQTNLNSVLSNLSSNARMNYNNFFFNATAGENAPDIVYGLYMCRGNLANDICRNCVEIARTDIVKRCPKEKNVIIWYDECMLRYDNRSFFSIMDDVPAVFMWNARNITEVDRFWQVLEDVLSDLATRASDESTFLRGFATGETSTTDFMTLYSLVQCTPDLSGTDCNRCFRAAIDILPACCRGKLGGRVFLPSCNIRYETYPFSDDRTSTFTTAVYIYPDSPASIIQPPRGNGNMSIQVIIAIVASSIVSILLVFTLVFSFLRLRRMKYRAIQEASGIDGNDISMAESLQYALSTIGAATNSFSAVNKVGEGGFGEVFKGTLLNGQEIAVKRLSRSSGQGAVEFKNEVVVVAKLQHRNLVRLVGFCLERDEKILIYEFVPNRSLDYFLFDQEKQQLLDWPTRYKIIGGIAQGILYLHEHSRLKIIHRDLKASNVLLDGDMNPKISDFGMARIFGVDQSQANTSRIVGTFGYMAPEYVMHGEFSVKSDVFSFGVLLLEIVSGKKSNSYRQSGGSENLLSHAWKHWKDGTPLEFVDPTLADTIVKNEVIRCINVGLLCVQENAEERPTMASVVQMLDSYSSITIPLVHQPAFFPHSRTEAMLMQLDSGSNSLLWSRNEASITELYPR